MENSLSIAFLVAVFCVDEEVGVALDCAVEAAPVVASGNSSRSVIMMDVRMKLELELEREFKSSKLMQMLRRILGFDHFSMVGR